MGLLQQNRTVFDPSEVIDLEAIRARLRKMTDRELLEYGRGFDFK